MYPTKYTIKELAEHLQTDVRKTDYLTRLLHMGPCDRGHYHLTEKGLTVLELTNMTTADIDVLCYEDKPYDAMQSL
jgi:hypothetical protein